MFVNPNIVTKFQLIALHSIDNASIVLPRCAEVMRRVTAACTVQPPYRTEHTLGSTYTHRRFIVSNASE